MEKSAFLAWSMKVFKGFLVLGCVYLLVQCAPVLYLLANRPSCEENSEAVTYARSLSPARLSKLYSDMEKYSVGADPVLNKYYPMREQLNIEIPEEFEDLEVVRITPDNGNIMVQGCFDHYVYMRFLGVGRLKRHHKINGIELSWGEATTAGKEMLWIKK
jgi:hypothetical protein